MSLLQIAYERTELRDLGLCPICGVEAPQHTFEPDSWGEYYICQVCKAKENSTFHALQ